MTNALLISSVVRNHAIAYAIGAGIMGIVLMHVLFVQKMKERNGFLLAINTILGLALAGLAFGTME